MSAAVDRCAKCEGGYSLKDGKWHWEYEGVWVYIVLCILGALVLFAVAWLVEWLCSPTINRVSLQKGMVRRERTRLKIKEDEGALRDATRGRRQG